MSENIFIYLFLILQMFSTLLYSVCDLRGDLRPFVFKHIFIICFHFEYPVGILRKSLGTWLAITQENVFCVSAVLSSSQQMG